MGSGEIPFGLADIDVVAPEGAAGPSWRASGLPFLSPRRVPGETLGSSVVIVASLLGGVDWYRRFGVSELGGRSPVDAAVTRLRRFCRSAVIGICFFSFFSFLSFGRVCVAFAPAPIVGCIGCLLCNTKRGETLKKLLGLVAMAGQPAQAQPTSTTPVWSHW